MADVPRGSVVCCARCGIELTGSLAEIETPSCPLAMAPGQPALPSGVSWTVRRDHVSERLAGLAEGNLVVCRRDLRNTHPSGNRSGCCGPTGEEGPNLSCPAGHVVATEIAECWTPHLAHFSAEAVVRRPTVEKGIRLVVFEPCPYVNLWHFFGWLHKDLDLAEWFGVDAAALSSWGALQGTAPVRILWRDAHAATDAGIDLDALATALDGPAGWIALIQG